MTIVGIMKMMKRRKMMSNIEDLIASAEKLCKSLDSITRSEKKFYHNLSFQLERVSWDALCISNDLKQIKKNLGENE